MEQNYSNPKSNKLKQAGLGILGLIAGAYITGTALESNRLSQELKPLEMKLETIAKTHEPIKKTTFDEVAMRERTTFDYGGQIDSINKVVQQFAENNNAYARNWGILGDTKTPRSPAPLALNPKYWGQKINTQTLKNYK